METWLLLAIVSAALLLGLFASGARIAIAMGIPALLLLYTQGGTGGLMDAGFAMYNTFHSFTLVALPLFLLMGQFLMRGSLMENVYQGMESWIHRVPGGLLICNILACTVFAAISGSSTATVVTIGQIAIPQLRRLKYKASRIYGSIAAGGGLGILIPPSLNMIVYGAVTGTPVGHLFMAGVFSGLLLSSLYMTSIIIIAMFRGVTTEPLARRTYSWKVRVSALPSLIPVVLLVLMVMGTIYMGIATPTEAAATGTLGAIFIAIAFREFSWKNIKSSLFNTAQACAWMFFIVACATMLGYGLSRAGVTRGLGQIIADMQLTPTAFVILLMGLYVIMGCFMDGLSMMLLTMPVFLPILKFMGIDMVWFGVLIILMTETASLTPPIGINLFIVQGIAGQGIGGNVPFREVAEGAVPFVVMLLITMTLVTAFPEIATWLPSQMK